MPWGRVDDTFHSHPKVIGIPRCDRAAAIGVYWLAISWSNAHTTDGFLPTAVLDELCGTPEIAATLVLAKLWHRSGSKGWRVHDFADYSPTKAEVAERSAQKAAAGRLGALKRWQNDGTSHSPNGTPIAPAMPLLDGSDSRPIARARASRPHPIPDPEKRTPPPPTSGGRRKDATNPRSVGTSPRQEGDNPRSNGTSTRQERDAQKRGPTSLREIVARLQAAETPPAAAEPMAASESPPADAAAAEDSWFEPPGGAT